MRPQGWLLLLLSSSFLPSCVPHLLCCSCGWKRLHGSPSWSPNPKHLPSAPSKTLKPPCSKP
jgi:hypothetical protein